MTNSPANSTHQLIQNFSRPSGKRSDEAPMVITRLSGWIDFGDGKTNTPSWILPTRTPERTQ